MKRAVRIGLVVVVCFAACGGDDDDDDDDDDVAGIDAAAPAADAPGGLDRATVSFTTTDGKNIAAYLYTSNGTPADSPGVLLIHQYQRDKDQWGDFPEQLVAEGYRVLAIDLRGHGASDPYDGSLIEILSDPDGPTHDVDAALAYLAGDASADPTRIAIVGTSIGANLTVAAAINDQAKRYVSLSSRQSAVEIYAGGGATGMEGVYYFAGENDSGGTQAANAQTMYDNTAEPKALQIYAGTADHGIAILTNQSDARGLIVDWLATAL